MPRKGLPENQRLPKRWKVEHGAYFYFVPEGQETHWDGKRRSASELRLKRRTRFDQSAYSCKSR
jgi:hypothetical protein